MNKKMIRIAGWALGLSMAVAGIGVAMGTSHLAVGNAPTAVKATSGSSLSISSYATANSWVDTTRYTSIVYDSHITLTGLSNGNNSKYYSSNNSWRHYEGDSGAITITATDATLTSVTFNYSNGNSGVLKYDGVNKTSGTAVSLGGATSAEFTVGHSSGSKNGNVQITSFSVTYQETSGTTYYSVTYAANGATSGSVPTDATSYEDGDTVTVATNSGNLAKTGYTFGGWNTSADGTGTNYSAGTGTFTITDDTTLYAKWNVDTLSSLSISGSMTKTQYKVNDSWDPTGFTVTANYQSGNHVDVTNDAGLSWTYSPAKATSTSVVSVTATASFGGKSVTSSAQAVTVTEGVTYDLTKISDFSSWTNAYAKHTVTHTDVGASASATMAFSVTNKQGSGVGSTYPCIGAKTESELECLTFTLNQSGKKITSVDIVFVTRYTTTYPSLYLHKGSGIASTPLETLTMSGNQASEHTLSVSNLNDTVFTVGYNAHTTAANGAVGIKSISIGLADQASFGTLDHISVTTLPNVVYHVGETFDPTGLVVTAYDGANEATANFKDVTASVETDLDDPTPFVDGDVPGFDCDVSYSGDGGSDTTSFHVYVYALAEYDLVTEEPTDWSGQYLITGTNYDSDLVAMNGGLANPDVPDGYKAVTDSAGSIETGQELEWTIAKVTGGYSIQGKSGKYIGSLPTKSNGMLVSETPLVNTISYADGAVSITGTNDYNLKINNETNSSRFRYYSSGTVQLYKLKESTAASDYADAFLTALQGGGTPVCDADGDTDLATLKTLWKNLADDYASDLSAVEKEQFRLGVSSTEPGASNIAKTLALYDYIAAKYNTKLQGEGFVSNYDFMQRGILPMSGHLPAVMDSNTTMPLVVTVAALGTAAAAGFFLFQRKRKEF